MFKLGHHEILVGLGSNSPDALTKLRAAKKILKTHKHFRLKKCSSIYESEALLPEGAPPEWNIPYLNAALLLEVRGLERNNHEDALRLVKFFKEIEKKLGRTEGPRWSPRPIDLDLLAWDGPSLQGPEIFVPHKEMMKRAFVILPALDCVTPHIIPEDVQKLINAWSHDVPFKTQRAKAFWPELMAIINVTPDSFSDGGTKLSQENLRRSIEEATSLGASLIDIGAESTRPGSLVITPDEEWERLKIHLPLLKELKKDLKFKLSLDSRHAKTIKKFSEQLELDLLNDVEGFINEEMLLLAQETQIPLVFMHSLSIPLDPKKTLPINEDTIENLLLWGKKKIEQFDKWEIKKERLIFDPGLGFGKTLNQNYQLTQNCTRFNELGLEVLIGHSRKSYLDPHNQVEASTRDLETALISFLIGKSGADYLRLHDLKTNSRALLLANQIKTP